MQARHWLFIVPLAAILNGCIVHDQITTLVINPDGSGDLTIYRSNIRSTKKGNAAEMEIAEYHAAFNARTHNDFVRFRESGARIEKALWLREQVPMAHVLHVAIPDAASLEKLGTLKDAEGAVVVAPKFTIADTQRRLALHIPVDPENIPPADTDDDQPARTKQARASSFSEARIVLSAGKISDARGFIIARDGRSALFDADEIQALLRSGQEKIEIFIQWDVPTP